MNTSINFELAKLLKEKGYPFEFITVGELKEVPLNIPIIAEVVMWVYEKYGIWIVVSYEVDIETNKIEWFWISIRDGEEIAYQYKAFKSPTEAYQEAIEYVLQNLI
jgi:hypothetical protein